MCVATILCLNYSQAIRPVWGSVLKFRYTVVSTEAGWIFICGTARGLRCLTLPLASRRAALAASHDLINDAVEDSSAFGDLPSRLQRYFNGEKVAFLDGIDLSGATAFQKAVWDATRSISYGEVRSYGWLAQQIEKPRAYRAVGQSLARNPLPLIVPCHRVIAGDGSLGGFSGGLELKQYLLDLEAGRLQTGD